MSPRGFSYQMFAMKTKTAKSYLKLVTEKKRHISVDKVFRVCDFFDLNDFEKQYFLFLFLRDVSKEAEARAFFQTVLSAFKAHGTRRTKTAELHSITSSLKDSSLVMRNWIALAILGLAKFKNFDPDPHWIQEKLGGAKVLNLGEIRQTLKELEEHQFLVWQEGKLKRADDVKFFDDLPFDVEGYEQFQTGLHRTSLALKLRGKTTVHRPNRHQLYCLSLSRENLKELTRLYDEFETKFRELSQKPQEQEVLAFISNNVFALSN